MYKFLDATNTKVLWSEVLKMNYYTFGPPKSADTFFLFIHDCLPSLVNIRKWFKPKLSTTCMICDSQPETSLHVFLCPRWVPVWHSVISILSQKYTVKSITSAFLPDLVRKNSKLFNTFVFATMRHIWIDRNAKVYEDTDICTANSPPEKYFRK